MKVTILVKPVPYKSVVDREGNVVRTKIKNIINKDDRCAIEEALKICPMPLPDFHEMQDKLLNSFPYDLWE